MGAQDVIAAITCGLAQSERLLKLDTPLGSDVLVPQRVIGRSRVGRHFEFTVDVVSTSPDIELKKLIAQPVTLWIQQSNKSYLPHNGFVHTARRLGSDSTLTSYQIGFASWMHFLKFRRDQRIWQDVSVEEIVSDVFSAHPQAQGRFQFALSQALPTRSYCRQDEYDWNFVHRLLESEGLYGFWQHAEDGKSHTLVIADNLSTFEAMSPQAVRFYRAGTNSEADAVTQWSGTRTLQSALLTTRTFDYKTPPVPITRKAPARRRCLHRARCLRKRKSTNIPAPIHMARRTAAISFHASVWKSGSRAPSAFTVWAECEGSTLDDASH